MKRSLWTGYFIAPFTGPLLYGIIILFYPATYENKEFSTEPWLLSILIFILASYVACFLFGAPLILLLKKYKKYTFSWLAVIGSCLYALIIDVILFVLMKPTIVGNIYLPLLKTTLIGFAMGMLIITVFSYFAGITRRTKGIRREMSGILADIYVLADDRSAHFVNSFLDEFIPEREPTGDEWYIPEYSDEPDLIITTIAELLDYCETHSQVTQQAYWNNTQDSAEPHSAHVFYLSEGKVILGLSTNDESLEQTLLERLKTFAGTDLGYITYECPPEDTVGEFTRMAQA